MKCPTDKTEIVVNVLELELEKDHADVYTARCFYASRGCKFWGPRSRVKRHFLDGCDFIHAKCSTCKMWVNRWQAVEHRVECKFGLLQEAIEAIDAVGTASSTEDFPCRMTSAGRRNLCPASGVRIAPARVRSPTARPASRGDVFILLARQCPIRASHTGPAAPTASIFIHPLVAREKEIRSRQQHARGSPKTSRSAYGHAGWLHGRFPADSGRVPITNPALREKKATQGRDDCRAPFHLPTRSGAASPIDAHRSKATARSVAIPEPHRAPVELCAHLKQLGLSWQESGRGSPRSTEGAFCHRRSTMAEKITRRRSRGGPSCALQKVVLAIGKRTLRLRTGGGHIQQARISPAHGRRQIKLSEEKISQLQSAMIRPKEDPGSLEERLHHAESRLLNLSVLQNCSKCHSYTRLRATKYFSFNHRDVDRKAKDSHKNGYS
ncbi:hypothetical protein HPB48_020780 [Haemaphysalis longicornis]|uniref:Uncharacterized protein n=1 Tax=Haemaphysalis longicornis TaxID=44386 RepID=A0A9J6FCY2_HAELO|nr:hypothetical protein HPB48_020780 [Haemaphysalis longicornis]